MTVKALIKILQEYNQKAEVRVVTDRRTGDTTPISLIKDLEESSVNRFGFLGGRYDEEKQKKKTKKVVIA